MYERRAGDFGLYAAGMSLLLVIAGAIRLRGFLDHAPQPSNVDA